VRLARDRYKEVTPAVWAVAVIFIIAAMYVLNLVIEQIGIPNTMEETFIAMSRNPWGALSIALLAPILEELLFRGAIQGYLLSNGNRPWVAITIASLIFGVVHMNPAQIPFAFLLGMMFGWLYYRTGSLLPGIVGHILNNSIATLGMMLYGDTTIEEQMPDTITMWIWALVALVIFIKAAKWLDHHLSTPSSPLASKEEHQGPLL
jgi:membrane protease YdiL (CAAX protease family)